MWVWELISWHCFILDHFVPFRWLFHAFDVSVWVMSPPSQFPNRFNISSRESCVVSIHMRSFIWTFQSICKILPTSLIILKYLLRCYIVNYTVFYWSFVKRKLYETKSLEMFFIRHGRLKFTAYTSLPCIFPWMDKDALNSTIYRIFSYQIFIYSTGVRDEGLASVLTPRGAVHTSHAASTNVLSNDN